eukprot:3375015-Rhodomonas_salina.1
MMTLRIVALHALTLHAGPQVTSGLAALNLKLPPPAKFTKWCLPESQGVRADSGTDVVYAGT